MVSRVLMAWTFRACALLWFTLASCASLDAQGFVDRDFREYPVKTAPGSIEQPLKRFLADRMGAGEDIDVVSDPRGGRILVRGSEEVQQLAAHFIRVMDEQPSNPSPAPQSGPAPAAARTVRAYAARSPEELARRAGQLRQRYASRIDVRIASDQRTGQILVDAPREVHQDILASWSETGPRSNPRVAPASGGPTTHRRLTLRNISWQDLLIGLRGVQGQNAAVGAPTESSQMEVTLASPTGQAVRLQIDEGDNSVQLTGTGEAIEKWAQVVRALDQRPIRPGETTSVGAVRDAQPADITRTIAMLGGHRAAGLTESLPEEGGARLTRIFGQRTPPEPLQLAQADAPNIQQPDLVQDQADTADEMAEDEAAGSFLGPVHIQFLEGTDIFIIRGQRRDVDRVMEIIRDIEREAEKTQPAIEIVHLEHTNSQAMAELVQQLNTGPLAARQGDISVTALVKPNALLLIGRAAGVEATKIIVEQLDVPLEPSAQFRVFQLQHIPAVDAERTINVLFPPALPTAQPVEETQGLAPRIRVVADFRSNAIVAYGSPRDLQEIGELLDQIDVETSEKVSEIRVFPLRNALAEEVEEVLETILRGDPEQQQAGLGGLGAQLGGQAGAGAVTLPRSSPRATMLQMTLLDEDQKEILASGILSDVTVAANERANSVVVVVPRGSMDLIAQLIEELDKIAAQEADIIVYTAEKGDAESLIEMLRALFERDDQADGPAFQTAAGSGESSLVPLRFALDRRTNSVIASGSPQDLLVVEAILLKLESQDISARRTEVYELLNAPALEVAAAVTQFLTRQREVLLQDGALAITPFEQIEREVVVVAEENSNKLIISATERYFEEVMQLIRDLDKRSDMVLIQVLIAEVSLSDTEELGVELGIQDSLLFDRSIVNNMLVPGFNFNNTSIALGNSASAESLATRENTAGQALSNLGLGRQNSELGFGGLVLSASSESVSVLIRALQAARRIDILSRPQITTLNNQEAFVQVGASVPFILNQTAAAFGIQNQTSFVDVGIILRVIPRISPDGLVVMDILADKSQLGPESEGIPVTVTETGDVLRQPQILTTRAQTVVSARDGQTVILGGLIDTSRESFSRQVPYLGDIPFFGRLFRTDGVAEERNELLIIMTPKIIRGQGDLETQEDLDRVNSEEYARMSWCLADVIEMYGDIGPVGVHHARIEGEIIYPDLDASPGDVDPSVPGPNWIPDRPPAPDALGPGAARPQQHPLPEENAFRPASEENGEAIPGTGGSAIKPGRSVDDSTSHAARPVAFQRHSDDPRQQHDHAVYRFDEVPQR